MSKTIKFRIGLSEKEVVYYWKTYIRECFETESKKYVRDDKMISVIHQNIIVTNELFYLHSTFDYSSGVRSKNVSTYKCCFVVGLNPFEVQPNENKLVDRKGYLIYEKANDISLSVETSIDNLDVFNNIMRTYRIEISRYRDTKSIPLESDNRTYKISMNCSFDSIRNCSSYYIEAEYIGKIGNENIIKNEEEAIKFLTNLPIIKNNFDISKIDSSGFDEC